MAKFPRGYTGARLYAFLVAAWTTFGSASAARAMPCRPGLRELYDATHRRSQVRDAQVPQSVEASQLGPTHAPAQPGEFLRMYRFTREDARVDGPLALAHHTFAYGRALLGTRTYFEWRRGELYESIYEAEEHGRPALRDILRERQKQFARTLRQLDVQVASLLARISEVPGIPPELASEALIERGLALGRLGKVDEAQAIFDHLVANYPATSWWSLAQLLVADHHLDAGRVADARRHYQRLSRGKPDLVNALASYRLAHTLLNGAGPQKPDPEASLRAFVVTIAKTRSIPGNPRWARQIRRDARRDLPRAYAAARGPNNALAELKMWGTDPGRGEDIALIMGTRLAEHYLALDKPDASSAVYRQLLTAQPHNPRACVWRTKVLTNSFARPDPQRQWVAFHELLATLRTIEGSELNESIRKNCRFTAATALAAMARDWHTRGLAERNPALQREAATAYRTFSQQFPNANQSPSIHADSQALATRQPPRQPRLCTTF